MLRKSSPLDPGIVMDAPVEIKTSKIVLFADPLGFFVQERRLDGIRVFSTYKTGKLKINKFFEWAKKNQDKLQKMTIHRVIGVLRRYSIKAKVFRPTSR